MYPFRPRSRHASLLFLTIILITGVVACGGSAPTATLSSAPSPPVATESATQETSSIPYETVAQDAPLGDVPAQPAYAVISASQTWDQLEEQLPGAALQAGRSAAQDQLLLVAFAGAKASSGYQVTISAVETRGAELLVSVQEQQPTADDIVEPAMTMPFHIVAVDEEYIPVQTTTVRFRDESGQTLAEFPLP